MRFDRRRLIELIGSGSVASIAGCGSNPTRTETPLDTVCWFTIVNNSQNEREVTTQILQDGTAEIRETIMLGPVGSDSSEVNIIPGRRPTFEGSSLQVTVASDGISSSLSFENINTDTADIFIPVRRDSIQIFYSQECPKGSNI